MESSGNAISNGIYEGKPLANERRPRRSEQNHDAQAAFVEAKYKKLEFFCKKTYESHDSWFASIKEGVSTHRRSFTDVPDDEDEVTTKEYGRMAAKINSTPTNADLGYGDEDLGYGDLGYESTTDDDDNDEDDDFCSPDEIAWKENSSSGVESDGLTCPRTLSLDLSGALVRSMVGGDGLCAIG